MADPATPRQPSVAPSAPDADELVPVVITAIDGASRPGEIRVRRLGSGARFKRAARVLGLCWLIAIGFILVPVLHWVLLPGMLIAGPIIASFWLKFDRAVVGGSGTCPACRSPLTIGGATHPEGFSTSCRACRSSLRVSPAPRA